MTGQSAINDTVMSIRSRDTIHKREFLIKEEMKQSINHFAKDENLSEKSHEEFSEEDQDFNPSQIDMYDSYMNLKSQEAYKKHAKEII